jgi:hypothetical protein
MPQPLWHFITSPHEHWVAFSTKPFVVAFAPFCKPLPCPHPKKYHSILQLLIRLKYLVFIYKKLGLRTSKLGGATI